MSRGSVLVGRMSLVCGLEHRIPVRLFYTGLRGILCVGPEFPCTNDINQFESPNIPFQSPNSYGSS